MFLELNINKFGFLVSELKIENFTNLSFSHRAVSTFTFTKINFSKSDHLTILGK